MSEEDQALLEQLLDDVLASSAPQEEHVIKLYNLIKTQEIRDYTLSSSLYAGVYALLRQSWSVGLRSSTHTKIWFVVENLPLLPEFDASQAAAHIDTDFLRQLFDRFDINDAEELQHVRDLSHWIYSHAVALRPTIRQRIGSLLVNFVRLRNKRIAVSALLEVLSQILRGLSIPLGPPALMLMSDILLPLHLPTEMAEWRDQLPLLQVYHEPLVHCVCALLEKDRTLSPTVILYLLENWPEGFNANTPKEVLFIHELEKLIQYIEPEQSHQVLVPIMHRVSLCVQHDNTYPIERALQLFKNQRFLSYCQPHSAQIIAILMRPLLREGKVLWNPTVNKMTALVLEQLESLDEESFRRECENIWGQQTEDLSGAVRPSKRPLSPSLPSLYTPNPETKTQAQTQIQTSSSSSMRPPHSRTYVRSRFSAVTQAPETSPDLTSTAKANAKGEPPVTITGVAPWAHKDQVFGVGSGARRPSPTSPKEITEKESEPPSLNPNLDPITQMSGHERVKAYIQQLKPKVQDVGPSWHDLCVSPTPTYVHTLKFHDLVFGQELGHGAFSVVKYARHVIRDRTRSTWPEYAVKVISTHKMRALGYENCVKREIAVLQVLSHPGIARMVSSFKWRDGAYLVLEYASMGDLHTHIISRGALDEDTTRFVCGEIIAALITVHDLGFVYGDLKPENVVITERNHVKLTDFGGCRAITSSAKELLRQSRNVLDNLRDGDWRQTSQGDNHPHPRRESDTQSTEQNEEDDRVEGTPAYLPPEVLTGGVAPDLLSDAWALGCTLYFCLKGRPPAWGSAPEEVLSHVVRFSNEVYANESTLEGLSQEAKDLTTALLKSQPAVRMSVLGASQHAFFTSKGVNVLNLHFGPPITFAQGGIQSGPPVEADWARRQFSKIWSPMPKEFDFTRGGGNMAAIPETDFERDKHFVARGSTLSAMPMQMLQTRERRLLPIPDTDPSLP